MKLTPSPTIFITGGHLTPALATIDQLKSCHLIFIGRRHTGQQTSLAHESSEISQRQLTFIPFDPPKFHRKPLNKNLGEFFKAPQAFFHARSLIHQYRPNAVLSFGGYMAPPIVFAAASFKIPAITHEQTFSLGMGNHLIAPFCRKIALSWPQTFRRYKSNPKYVLTGNPVRAKILTPQSPPSWFTPQTLPIIFITGGNQGAQAINQFILSNLDFFTSRFFVIHQTGSTLAASPEQINSAIKALPPSQRRRYHHQSWLTEAEMAWTLQSADLVVSRAGANTVTELLVTQTNSILIPLPVSAGQEQQTNAAFLQSTGLAVSLDQANIKQLRSLIIQRIKTPTKPLTQATQKLIKLHQQAAQTLASLVLSCVSP